MANGRASIAFLLLFLQCHLSYTAIKCHLLLEEKVFSCTDSAPIRTDVYSSTCTYIIICTCTLAHWEITRNILNIFQEMGLWNLQIPVKHWDKINAKNWMLAKSTWYKHIVYKKNEDRYFLLPADWLMCFLKYISWRK